MRCCGSLTLVLALLLLFDSLAYFSRNFCDVTCFENVVANVDGDTAPNRHGLGDAFRVVRVRFGLAETDLVLSLDASVDRPRLGLETVSEFDLLPMLVRPGSSRFGFGETDLGEVPISGLEDFFSSIGSRSSDRNTWTLPVSSSKPLPLPVTSSRTLIGVSCCGGVGARVGRNGNPDPNLAPEFGDGGGGPEYVETRSGLGESDRVPERPEVLGTSSSFPVLADVTLSSFLEYLAELDRTKPVSEPVLAGDLDGDLESDLTRI